MSAFSPQDSYNCLLQNQQWLEEYCSSPSTTASSNPSSSVLPPPTLLAATETRIELAPPLAVGGSLLDQVAYYKLYGRAAAGSNVKVRETDKLFPGLGVEVT